jgi:hypothetical protein
MVQKLKDSKIKFTSLKEAHQCFKPNRIMIDFSIPILHEMLDCKLVRLYPRAWKARVLEYDPDLLKQYKFESLNDFDFHHYCAVLLISALIYYSCKQTLDPNYIKLKRDLTRCTTRNPKTKELETKKGIIIKPDFTILKSLDDQLYLILIKFTNHVESILKQATSFNYSFIENIRKK